MDKCRQTMITANNKLQNGRGWYSKGAEIVIQNKSKIPAVVTRKLPIIVGILWIAVILYIVIDYLRVQYCLFI